MAAVALAAGCGGGGQATPDGGGIDTGAADRGAADTGGADGGIDAGPPFVPPTPAEGTIGPAGGTVTLAGFADVTFPAGAFASDQVVRVEATADPAVASLFDETAAVFNLAGRSPYEVVVTVGAVAPAGDASIHLTVPTGLGAATQVQAYADVFMQSTDDDVFESFELAPAATRDATSITVVLAGNGFGPLRRADGQFQVALVLGALPAGTAASDRNLAFDDTGAQAPLCPDEPLSPPLASLTVHNGFDKNRVFIDPKSGVPIIGHPAIDFVAASGTPLYAVADGTVIQSGVGTQLGENVNIALSNGGGVVLYAHMMSRNVKKGDKVCRGQQIGTSDNTGTATTGPHLHFEYAPAGGARSDPLPCIDPGIPVPQTCGKWSGSIHLVTDQTEYSTTEEITTTVHVDDHMHTEERWTFGNNHDAPGDPNTTLVDLHWAATENTHLSTVTEYKSTICSAGASKEVTSNIGAGSKPSQLQISGRFLDYILALPLMGNLVQIPSHTTKTDCAGDEMSSDGMVPLIESGTLAIVMGLANLTPDPNDPNLFRGNTTVVHDEQPLPGAGMQVLDIKADWTIRRNTQ
jgi:murein DD-endopeptidase MepM/ murein hydrolase activator NlpD